MNDKKLPIIGIIIPYHKHPEYILEALESVINQDYPNKIICIIDDGSNDNLQEIISKKYEEYTIGYLSGNKHKYNCNGTTLVLDSYNSALGPSSARNRGFEILFPDCDVFSVLDADDKYLPGKLTKCMEKYLEDPQNIGIVYHDVIIHNELLNTDMYEYREPYSRQRLEQEDIICNCPIISKKAIQQLGGYDPNMRTCEDWDLWLRLTNKFIAIHIPEALSMYRVTGKNSSDTVDKNIWNQNWNIISQRIQAYHQHNA